MSDRISTAAELDALPCHSVVMSADRLVVVQSDGRIWRTPGIEDALTSARLIEWKLAPLVVLYRPDLPARTVVDDLVREAVKEYVWDGDGGWDAVLAAHDAGVRAQALKDFANEMSPVYAIEGSAASHARAVADRAERGEV